MADDTRESWIYLELFITVFLFRNSLTNRGKENAPAGEKNTCPDMVCFVVCFLNNSNDNNSLFLEHYFNLKCF